MRSGARVFLSAGEPSGEAHGAALVAALRSLEPDTLVDALGTDTLAAAGARLVASAHGLAAFGLVETAAAIPRHVRALGRIRRALQTGEYAAATLIDYPGFHLRVARYATERGIPVLYYVPPQVWAWAPGRARTLRRSVTLVASVLPFEPALLARLNIRSTFVGHPVLEAVRPTRHVARRLLGLTDHRPVIAMLPGSRAGDVDRHWPLFLDTARQLHARMPDVAVVLAAVPAGEYCLGGDIPILVTNAWNALAAADAALCKSGSATLEAAVAGVPMVIAYRLHPATFALARRLVRVPYVGLPNLIAGRMVVPE
ncbi:MAG TPA: lipid-A-disaccharide synthase, partial [Gemmatimonadales bacterium]|nr:lipid-A-disaccharide synthase [Gemmatimonadales bacterium]